MRLTHLARWAVLGCAMALVVACGKSYEMKDVEGTWTLESKDDDVAIVSGFTIRDGMFYPNGFSGSSSGGGTTTPPGYRPGYPGHSPGGSTTPPTPPSPGACAMPVKIEGNQLIISTSNTPGCRIAGLTLEIESLEGDRMVVSYGGRKATFRRVSAR